MTFTFGTETLITLEREHRPNSAFTHGSFSYGLRFYEACVTHVNNTFHATSVYVIASRSLSTNTTALDDLKNALGSKIVGVRVGMTSHTLWSECLEVTSQCRELGVDLLITLGGGSLSDAAKLIALALANDTKTAADIKKLPSFGHPVRGVSLSRVPIICVATTLSGGEYTRYSGATEDETKMKVQFGPLRGPELIVLDPELTVTTPDKYWLSTGIRAVDHCVETLTALVFDEDGDVEAIRGLKALISGLLSTKQDRTNLDPRHKCQLGVVDAISAICRPTVPSLGASHAIGHMLGPLGVGHGETSCILLPAVCKFNAVKGANVARQEKVVEVLWTLPEVQSLGLNKEKADLGDILDAFFQALGMPRTLAAVGVVDDQFEQLAENTLHDGFAATNPYPLKRKEDVLEILEMVRG